jgi:hypothetical protein
MYLIIPSYNDAKHDKFVSSEGVVPDRKLSPRVNQRTIISLVVNSFLITKEAFWYYLHRSSLTIWVRFPN